MIRSFKIRKLGTHLDDVQGLVNGALGGERVVSVNLGGDTSWDDGEDLLSKLDEETVESGIDLVVDIRSTVLLSVSDGNVDKLGVLRLLGRSEDQGGVGGGILGLVLGNSYLDVSIRASWGLGWPCCVGLRCRCR